MDTFADIFIALYVYNEIKHIKSWFQLKMLDHLSSAAGMS